MLKLFDKKFLGLFFLTFSLALGVTAQAPKKDAGQDDFRELRLNEKIERQIGVGEKHIYHVFLRRGELFRVALLQNSDVIIAIADENGKVLKTSDDVHEAGKTEKLFFLPESEAEYMFGVFAAKDSAAKAKYILQTNPPLASEEKSEIAKSLATEGDKAYENKNFEIAALYHENSVKFYRELPPAAELAYAISSLGGDYFALKNFQAALDNYVQSARLFGAAKETRNEAIDLWNVGICYFQLQKPNEAIVYYEKALTKIRAAPDRKIESSLLVGLGDLYNSVERFDDAVYYYEQALKFEREATDREREMYALNGIGTAQMNLGDYEQSLTALTEALKISRELKNSSMEANVLMNLGLVYTELGQYDKPLEYYAAARKIAQEIKDRNLEANLLINEGVIYFRVASYAKSFEYYVKSLQIGEDLHDKTIIATSLADLGNTATRLGKYNEAIGYFEKAIPLQREINEMSGVVISNYYYGIIMRDRGNFERALALHEESVKLAQQYKVKKYEARSLYELGADYLAQNQIDKAIANFERALFVAHEVKVRDNEARALDGLMQSWQRRGVASLAIFYGKQAINLHQKIRQDIKNFDKADQSDYLNDNKNTYRTLAELLIQAGRIPEAQQVLGMLKEEEYSEFVQRDEGEAKKLLGNVELSSAESDAVARYEKISKEITTKAAEYEKLKKQRPTNEEEKAALDKRKSELSADLTAASQTFNLVLKQIETEFSRAKRGTDISATINENRGLQADLARWKLPNTVILSTIVGEENYSVILTTPTVQIVGQTPVKSGELNKIVHDFREAVQNPCACIDPRPLGQKLYDILLKPIAPQLAELEKQAGGKPLTLVWSLDGTLRYLPISALWDGEKYLTQRFLNVEFSLASRTRLGENPNADWRGLGVGVTLAHADFSALPAVKDELLNGAIHDEKILDSKGIVPGRVFLDAQFTENTFAQELSSGEYPLVHIASHFAFKPGNEKQSYLLMGDGGELSLDKMRTSPDFKFNGVELLTLSACNTATGEAGADGKEFESFAVLAQQNGALAVLATLWSVADESTQILMSEFYRAHQENHLSKAESLRAAQLVLLNGDLKTAATQNRRSDLASEISSSAANLPAFTKDPKKPFAHPYYWSPFVLIGNWR